MMSDEYLENTEGCIYFQPLLKSRNYDKRIYAIPHSK